MRAQHLVILYTAFLGYFLYSAILLVHAKMSAGFNTCFLNAVLQCLFHTPSLCSAINSAICKDRLNWLVSACINTINLLYRP